MTDAPTHAAVPAQHSTRCTLAPLFNSTLFVCKESLFWRRVVIPLAHAANAHAIVKPYVGDALMRVIPTPKAVAVTIEMCPTLIRVESLTLMAMLPFKFTKVAAVIQPKCIVSGIKILPLLVALVIM